MRATREGHRIGPAGAGSGDRRGFDGATLGDIIEAGEGLSKGSLYFHVKSKEGLAEAVVEQHRTLGTQGLTVSAIGYGSMGTALGYGASDGTESVAAIRHAHDLGVAFFDTVDMFGPVLDEPIDLRSTVVRDGNRIRVVDSHIVQRGHVRARATAQYLIVSAEPPGQNRRPDQDLPVPDVRLDHREGSMPLFKPGADGWTHSFTSGSNAHRKTVWNNIPPLAEGMPITAFERSAVVADFTMALSRLPEGPELGLQARDHVSNEGIAVCAATLYDRT